MNGALGAIVAAFAVVVTLMIGVTVMDSIASGQDGLDEQVTRDAATLDAAGEFVAYNDGKGTDETVYKTTGYAVNMTGANDSYVESQDGFDVATDSNWTISIWAYPDQGNGGETMTALSADGRLVITFNGTTGNYSAWYYDEGSTDSYRVDVSAPNATGNYTNIIVKNNQTHFAIYRNNTLGESVDTTGDSVADAPVSSTNWDGRLEEVRTFDEPLNNSKRSELVNKPVEQQPDLNATSRIMFDQPDRSTQLILYTDTALETSNVTYSAGFDEQVMDPKTAANDLTGDTDYRWDEEGPNIAPTSGGELAGAPVAYADYNYATEIQDVVDGYSSFVEIASLIPILAIITVIIGLSRSGF